MNSKRNLLIGAALLVAGVLAWRWLGRTATEADDPNHPTTGTGQTRAVVARAERRIIANTQLLRYEGQEEIALSLWHVFAPALL